MAGERVRVGQVGLQLDGALEELECDVVLLVRVRARARARARVGVRVRVRVRGYV